MGHGFRNVDNLIFLLMLRCSDIKPPCRGGRRHEAPIHKY